MNRIALKCHYLYRDFPLRREGSHRQKKVTRKVTLHDFKTPRAGFEPATNRLTVDRSTAELPRNI